MGTILFTPRPKTGSISITKVITDTPSDETFFHVTVTGQAAEPTIVDGYVSQQEPLRFDGLPFDTYVITEDSQEGYVFGSIISDTVVLSRSNRNESVVVTNDKMEEIKYGLLYNWYAANDVRNITNTGWSLPSKSNYEVLSTFLGGNLISGDKLKESGTIYWNTPNSGNNSSNFNGRGAGLRNELGQFHAIKINGYTWTSTEMTLSIAYIFQLIYNASTGLTTGGQDKKYGSPIRLIKISTTLSDGEEGIYTGNDGKIYRTICIGTQEWLADNLAETKYRNGDTIPEVTDNSAWAALTTGAMCVYNNDHNNI